ncbi:Ger(x)C family germination protein [Cytobacillus eiseniae]|uniref:Ger(X)C family germination protein n=1 Tax=Cytobacillus eiseniae TaxID=762947 RepID=A0ABS4RAC2_9BACI|nr:Ger(x)C family spore germination protein [Cytobacillus eiseniae]MBP2239853.1 Ger(x)C family germination protein [Cytobacillus eiseniae]
MKRRCISIFVIVLVALLSSCGRNIPLEDLTISLILGVDLDDEMNLIISESSPVFNEDAKKNIETYQLKAATIRDSRKYFDALATGEVTAAKIQVLLIGKRVLEHEGWFSILDTVYRNPSFSINTKVIVVDGPVSEVIFYEPDDKPQMPLYLKEVIDKNYIRTRTVESNLQVLHRQMYEKGMTPTLPKIIKENDVKFVGVVLLEENGKYVDALSIQETSFLLILMDKQKQELTLSIPITTFTDEGGIFNKNMLSIDISKVKSKVTTNYKQGKFHFNYKISMTVNIIERIFPKDKVKEAELKKLIEKELLSRFEAIIEKIQENKIDPIGLGIYARAFQYEQYKKVEKQWGEALSESNIDISLDIDINGTGAIK